MGEIAENQACSTGPACSARARPSTASSCRRRASWRASRRWWRRRRSRRIFGCRPSRTISPTPARNSGLRLQRRRFLAAPRGDCRLPHAGQGRIRRRRGDRDQRRHHGSSSRPSTASAATLSAILWDPQAPSVVGIDGFGPFTSGLDYARPCAPAPAGPLPTYGLVKVTAPGTVTLGGPLHERYGKLPCAELFEPGDRVRRRLACSLLVARIHEPRGVDRLRSSASRSAPTPCQRPHAWAGELWNSRPGEDADQDRRERRRGLLSKARSPHDGQPRQGDRRRMRALTSPITRPTGSIPSASPIAAPLHEIPPSRTRASPPAWRSASRELRHCRLHSDGPESHTCRHRGEEARLRRHLAISRRPPLHGHHAGAAARQALPQEPRRADRSRKARVGPGQAPDGDTIYFNAADKDA